MTVTGHRTRAVFDRYHIVSPADLQEVARKRDALGASMGTALLTTQRVVLAPVSSCFGMLWEQNGSR